MSNWAIKELYVCLHVPEFPAQALLRLRPELARSPVVVLEGEAPLEQVASANARALRIGVRHAMTRRELDTFPGLQILRRSLNEERCARAVLMDAVGVFTPRAEVQSASGSAWVVVLDMAGSHPMFGDVQRIVKLVQEAAKALRFSVRIAASCNLRTAVCLAAFAMREPIVIPRGDEALHLSGLPVAALGLTTQQAEAFELWGIRTVGELAALPEVELIVRLGQQGKQLRLLAWGEHAHLMVPEVHALTLEELLELEAPVELMESLLFVLGPMIGQLVARARNHAFALASVTVSLGLDGGGEHKRTIKPALPLANREVLLKLLHLDLQAHPPAAAVLRVSVTAEPGERGKVQLGLWSPQLPEATRLDVTLARIAALVGEDRVGSAVLQDTHRQQSFCMKRFSVLTGSGPDEAKTRNSVALRRCRPPVVLAMRCEAGTLKAFPLHGVLYAVERAYGPWRRSGDWWASQVWSCEEWDVAAASPKHTLLCLISHDLLRRQWQLEAVYD